MNNLYLEDNSIKVQLLGRGFAWLDTGTIDSLSEAGNFVKTVQNMQGIMVSSPEEIAYRKGWITKEEFTEITGIEY